MRSLVQRLGGLARLGLKQHSFPSSQSLSGASPFAAIQKSSLFASSSYDYPQQEKKQDKDQTKQAENTRSDKIRMVALVFSVFSASMLTIVWLKEQANVLTMRLQGFENALASMRHELELRNNATIETVKATQHSEEVSSGALQREISSLRIATADGSGSEERGNGLSGFPQTRDGVTAKCNDRSSQLVANCNI